MSDRWVFKDRFLLGSTFGVPRRPWAWRRRRFGCFGWEGAWRKGWGFLRGPLIGCFHVFFVFNVFFFFFHFFVFLMFFWCGVFSEPFGDYFFF